MKTIQPYQHIAKYYETDQMAIIHHSNYIRWFEEARIDYLKQIGLPYHIMEEKGIISPVLEISCQYHKMMRFEDTATIYVKMTSYNGIKFEIDYEIYNQHQELCTTGHSKHCFLNKSGRPVSLKRTHPEYHEILNQLLNENKNL